MSTPKFVETYNLIVFLEKPKESSGFEEINDFLNANQIRYALTVNPTIYTSYIKQFLATAKVKTVDRERQLQALVDKKKVIITETSIRSDLHLEDASGIDCLPTATIFEELASMGAKTTTLNEFSSTMASAIICLATNQKFNLSKYIFDAMLGDMSHHKKTYVNPSHTKKIFANMKREGKDFSGRVTPLFATMLVQANQEEGKLRRKWRKDSAPTEPTTEETPDEAHVSTPSYDPSQSGKDRMKLIKLINPCTQLQSRVLALETTKSTQALEIESPKKKVKSLEKRRKSRTPRFKRLRKVGSASRVESSNDASLGAQEDASKQGNVLEEQEKDVAEKEVSTADPVTTAGEVVTTANVEVSTVKAPTTTIDELTLAQTLIEIKAAKPKAITSATTTTTTIRPKARGVVVQEPMPLKKKDQLALDEEMARNLEAQLQAKLIEEEKIARLQVEEQGEITIEERSRLFVELMKKRKKHFAVLRAQEKRRNPPTKAQKRNTMSTYLKNMARYKHNQLKSKSYDEIQEMFNKEMKRVNTFVDMNTELVKGSKTKAEGSSKRAGNELEQEKAKKQKANDDQKEAEMKRHIEIVKDDEVAIDVIPLATKPLVIVDYKIDKDGKMGYFKLIRADGSLKRYSSTIKMLQGIDREDLETFWKLVKAKYENKRPEDDYERVLWGDLKVMFELDIKSDVWRNL
ncbi:hypothetical protein Tco_0617814 [Tanacetum coccineum]